MLQFRATRLLPWFFLGLLTGCFHADLQGELLSAGSGRFTMDLAVNRASLPRFLGDPLASMDDPRWLLANTPPGVDAWAKPRRWQDGHWDHLTLQAYFDDIDRVQVLGSRGGQPFPLLCFRLDRSRPGHLTVLSKLAPYLDEPLPMPSPSDLGMGISVSPQLLDQIKPLLGGMMRGLQLRLAITAPGAWIAAPGFGPVNGRTARLDVDDELFVRALRENAGVLADAEALRPPELAYAWKKTSAANDAAALRAYREDRDAARLWWAEQLKAMAASGR